MIKGTVKLFKIFGIDINIHITFLLFILIFGLFYGFKGIVLVLLVFSFVTAHELSHSLLAKRFKIKVDSITLLPIGGIASMGSVPDKPRQEFMISIAGPMFNVILSLLLAYPVYLVLGRAAFFHPTLTTWRGTLSYAFWVNPMLAAFNLLPAFPMDGGRVLRAFLATRMNYVKATRIATTFGHLFALFFGFVGLVSRPVNIILVIIAVFIYVAASQEEMQVELKAVLKKFRVEDVLPTQFYTILPSTKLVDILAKVFHSHQEDFPVVEANRLVGIVTRSMLIAGIHRFGLDKKAEDIMIRDFPSLRPNDSLVKVQTLMAKFNLKALPVIKDDGVCGIITLEDISKAYMVMTNKG